MHNFFFKSRSHLKIIGVRWTTLRKPNPQISAATIRNLVARPTWRPEFVPAHYEGSYAGNEENHENGLSATWITLQPEGLINNTVHTYKSTYLRKVPCAKDMINDNKRSVTRRG